MPVKFLPVSLPVFALVFSFLILISQFALTTGPPNFNDYLRLGEDYLRHDQPGQAISEFEAAVNLEPKNATALYDLSLSLRQWGDINGAEEIIRKALRLQPDFPKAHFLLGLILGDRTGDEQRGLPEFEAAVAEDPSFADAYYNIGIIHWKANEFAQAAESFRQAVTLRPSAAQFRIRYGQALAKIGKLKDAERELERATALDPANRPAFYELALIEEKLGEKEESARTMGMVKRLQGSTASLPEQSQLNYNQGVEALERGEPSLAAQKLTRALHDPYNEEAIRTALAIAYEQEGEHAAAIAELHKVLRLDPNSADAHLNLGVDLMREGNEPEAEREFATTLSIYPNFPEAYYNLGLLEAAQRQWPRAAQLLQHAIRLSPNDARDYLALGRVLRDEGNPNEALPYLKKACQLDRTLIQAKSEYAKLLEAQNRPEDAIAVWEEALKQDPANPELYRSLESALKKQGEYQQAQLEQQKYELLTRGPSPGQPSVYQRGVDYLNHGEFERAINCFQVILRHEPNLDEVRRRLAFAQFAQGEYQAAAAQYQKLKAKDPTDPEARLDLGIALLRAGSLDLAKEELTEAIRLDPRSASAYYHLGLVYLAEKDTNEAMEQFHNARRINPAIRPPIKGIPPSDEISN